MINRHKKDFANNNRDCSIKQYLKLLEARDVMLHCLVAVGLSTMVDIEMCTQYT